ncbi:MAG: Gfo/Idh/MocA family oxidoreductase [bacterium]|nr:Gfo/Idh/MocA family oxidoreductase [bacterium]
MSKKIEFLLIGCGHIGTRHAGHISRQAELTAVCDIKEERAKALAEIHSCRYYCDINRMLQKEKGFDVASICTPNGLHAQQTIDVLQAGKHVLCEKPMAISVFDCLRMMEAEKKAGKKIFIVKQNRFNPPVTALKELLHENRLGRICNVQLNCFWNRSADYYKESDWKGRKDLDGGVLFTQFSHFIDLLYWLFGDVSDVYCMRKNFFHEGLIDAEDTGVVAMQFASGALGTVNYTVNSYKTNMEGSLTVFGEKGTVKIGGQYLNVVEYQQIENYTIPELPQSRPANHYGYYQGSMSNHDKVIANVLQVLQNNGTVSTSSFEGMKTVEIIEKTYAHSLAGEREFLVTDGKNESRLCIAEEKKPVTAGLKDLKG